MYNSEKLKLNLKLLQQRIKQISLKKQSLSNNARREIANLVESGKHESARIKVESIIREDYLVEAFEVLDLLSEILIARFGLIDSPTTSRKSSNSSVIVDEGIQEAVQTLIYAAPRCSSDLKELTTISSYLKSKFGREYHEAASSNRLGLVNPRVLSRLGVERPSDDLVTAYVREICKNYKTPFDEDDHLRQTSAFGSIGATAKNIPMFMTDDKQKDLTRPTAPPNYISSNQQSVQKVQRKSIQKDDKAEANAPKEEDLELELPDVKVVAADTNQDDNEDPNFDELEKRFEELKKKR